MMASRINQSWMKDKRKEIERGAFTSVVVAYNPAAQWLISYLAGQDIPVKVTSLGAGVKRITLAENICPICNGKGYTK